MYARTISHYRRGSRTHDRQQGRRRLAQAFGTVARSRVIAFTTSFARRRSGVGPRANQRLAAGAAERRGLLGRRARGRYDPRVGIHPADGLPGPRIGPGLCRGARAISRITSSPDGGWAIYPGGPTDVSASVKAYFALKLVGVSPDDPAMVRARQAILDAGGAHACNSFTRFYLALLGQISYDECPCVPPELVLIPSRLGFSLSAMSAWTRTIVVPLSIMAYFKPVRSLPAERGIAELFRREQAPPSRRTGRWLFAGPISSSGSTACSSGSIAGSPRPGGSRRSRRRTAGCSSIARTPTASVRSSRRWSTRSSRSSVSVTTWIRRRCSGRCKQLDDLHIAEDDRVRVQPCLSPVWDTAIASIALADAAGARRSIRPGRARSSGCSPRRFANPATGRPAGPASSPPAGTSSSATRFTPISTTARWCLLALNRSPLADDPAVEAATRRGVNWLLSMQNRDGGWAAYDVDIDNQVLTQLPFADHNAMLDPSCADITARVLELLGTLGLSAPTIRRSPARLDYLWSTQEPEGCWYGRWGVNYIYGTWQVLQGLKALDFPMDHPALLKAADWLESTQQPSGAGAKPAGATTTRR